MLIDYVSSAMDARDFEDLFRDTDRMPGQQAQKYNRLMIQGIAGNDVEVHAITGLPVTSSNCKKKYLSASRRIDGNIIYQYGSVLNIRGIKNLWQMISSYRSVIKDTKMGQTAVVCDVLNASVAYGASLAAKRKNIPCIGIVTDLPELMVTGTRKSHVRLVRKVLENCTGYIPLTEAMDKAINPNHKPYEVVEGLCDVNMRLAEKKVVRGVRKCMYAGLLDTRYGVKAMVDGFLLAKVPNVELHIYGKGPYVDELKEIANSHRDVIYHGVVMNDEVVSSELEASLLINPRPTNEEFTKYSFPSKNMEYMASGTPVLTTKLPGMPEDYYPYVFLIEDESEEGMAKAYRDILGKTDEELSQKGKQAKQFVLTKKNNVAQAKKVISLIENQIKI
ncbi:MAG: glycosyltransferase [Oscillospiraceae bacterium]|nr:glycosyltransferase [Oscillospiraceae bacterium]